MPYVRVEITDGATREQKLAVVKGITDVLVKVLNKNPEYTFVVIDEVDSDNWGHKGVSGERHQEGRSRGAGQGRCCQAKVQGEEIGQGRCRRSSSMPSQAAAPKPRRR